MLFTFASTGGFLSIAWSSQTRVSTATAGGGDLALCLFTFKTTILISFVSFYFVLNE